VTCSSGAPSNSRGIRSYSEGKFSRDSAEFLVRALPIAHKYYVVASTFSLVHPDSDSVRDSVRDSL
jgi:hypothetical protein